jgi:hypothetical protein
MQSAVSKSRTATVIWFDPEARCGFIKPDEGGHDLFARACTAPSNPYAVNHDEHGLVGFLKLCFCHLIFSLLLLPKASMLMADRSPISSSS